MVPVRFEGVNDGADHLIRQKVLSSDLDDAGRFPSASGEDCREVEIVRNDNEALRWPMSGSQRRARLPHRWWTSGQPRTRDSPAGRSSLATGSCPRAASRLAQRNFAFLSSPGGVGQSLGDVLGFEIGILAQDLVPDSSRGDEADDRADGDTHAPNAWLSAHDSGVTSDAR